VPFAIEEKRTTDLDQAIVNHRPLDRRGDCQPMVRQRKVKKILSSSGGRETPKKEIMRRFLGGCWCRSEKKAEGGGDRSEGIMERWEGRLGRVGRKSFRIKFAKNDTKTNYWGGSARRKYRERHWANQGFEESNGPTPSNPFKEKTGAIVKGV